MSRFIQKLSLRKCLSTSRQLELLESDQCILVDTLDREIGTGSKRHCHHIISGKASNLPLHRAFSIFIFSPSHNYRMLLQRRSMAKLTFPGYWANSCCSHPLKSDDSIISAMKRKLNQELGVDSETILDDDFIPLGKIHYAAPSCDPSWGEHELDHVYALVKDVNTNANPDEVGEIKWVNQAEIRSEFSDDSNNETEYAPWFRAITNDFFLSGPSWWNHIRDRRRLVPISGIKSYGLLPPS